MSTKKYINPPIVEAIITLKFPDNTKWDATLPGLLYNKLEEDYPTKKFKNRLRMNIDVERDREGSINIENPIGTSQFISSDGKDIIQLNNAFLSVNRLSKYPGWEIYKPKTLKAISSFLNICPYDKFSSISLRYINAFTFNTEKLKVDDYFNLYVKMPENFVDKETAFNLNLIQKYDEEIHANIRIYPRYSEERDKQLMLEIDINKSSVDKNRDNISELLEDLHKKIGLCFEEIITQKTRDKIR